MPWRRRALPMLSLLCLLALPLAAQSPAQRLALAAWDDSLQRAATVADLAALDGDARSGDGELRQLRRALYAARRGELGHDRGALEKALFDFDQASVRHRRWPWPEYGVAKVMTVLHFGGYIATRSDGQVEGESHAEATWRHLRDAITRDVSMVEARRLALRLLVAGVDRELPSTPQQLFDRMRAAPAPEADLLLVAGRLYRARRQFDSSVAAFDQALALGGDRGRLQLERARSLRSLGDSTSAVAAYWEGLKSPSATERTAYRTDLAWILPPDSLAAFDRVSSDSLLPWLTRFWGVRDMRSAKTLNGRLNEHLRRWAVAYANFRVTAPWRRTMYSRVEFGFEGHGACVSSYSQLYQRLAAAPPHDSSDIRGREQVLDHRGLIYLRHGEPIGRTERFSVTGASAPSQVGPTPVTTQLSYNPGPSQQESAALAESRAATTSWMYWIEGEWRVFFFRGSKAFGMQAPTTLTSYLPLDWIDEWLAVGRMAPMYAEAAAKLGTYTGIEPVSCLSAVKKAIKISREDATLGLATDSDSPPISHPWDAVLNVFAVGSARDQDGRALITFALPTKLLTASPRDSGRFGFDIRFRLSGFNRKDGSRFQIDTVRRFSADGTGGKNQFLSGLFEVPIEPGEWDISVLARQERDSAGGFAEIRSRHIPAGTTLAISDLVTGIAPGRPVWQAGGTPFPLNVLGTWKAQSPVEIYYEIYGLAAGSEYREALELRPMPGTPGKSIVLGSTGISTGMTTSVRRSVGLTQLKPGSYRLIVTVTRGGSSVVSERPILVVK